MNETAAQTPDDPQAIIDAVEAKYERKKRRRRRIWLTLLVLFVVFVAYGHWPWDKRIVVSPETTVIEGPLNDDGTVNYVAYVDAVRAEGVTPETNAVCLLLDALGPAMVSDMVIDEYCRRVGHTPDPGPYFVDLTEMDFLDPPGQPDEFGFAVDSESDLWDEEARSRESPWRPADLPHVDQWLKANAKPLEIILAASRRTEFYSPWLCVTDPPSMINGLLPSYNRIRMAGKALAARAMRSMGTGDYEAASRDILAVHRLGALIPEKSELIEILVAIAIRGLGTTASRQLANDPSVPADVLRAHLAALNALPPVQTVDWSVGRADRFMFLDMCQTLSRGGDTNLDIPSWTLRNLDWNSLLRQANAIYDDVLLAATQANTPQGQDAQKRVNQFLAEKDGSTAWMAVTVYTSPVLGRWSRDATTRTVLILLLGQFIPSAERAACLSMQAQAMVDVTRGGLALRLYRIETGGLPNDLADLAPKYLSTVPVDIFTGDPLRYDPHGDGFIVYSVGPNRRDDGGISLDDVGEEDGDLIFQHPGPKPTTTDPTP